MAQNLPLAQTKYEPINFNIIKPTL